MSDLIVSVLLLMCFGFTMSFYFNVSQRKLLYFTYMTILGVVVYLLTRGLI